MSVCGRVQIALVVEGAPRWEGGGGPLRCGIRRRNTILFIYKHTHTCTKTYRSQNSSLFPYLGVFVWYCSHKPQVPLGGLFAHTNTHTQTQIDCK